MEERETLKKITTQRREKLENGKEPWNREKHKKI